MAMAWLAWLTLQASDNCKVWTYQSGCKRRWPTQFQSARCPSSYFFSLCCPARKTSVRGLAQMMAACAAAGDYGAREDNGVRYHLKNSRLCDSDVGKLSR